MNHTYTTKGNRQYRYYVCHRAQKQGWNTCPSPSIPAGEVERFVVDQIKAIGRDPRLVEKTLAQARRQSEDQIERLRAEREALYGRLRQDHAELRQLSVDARPGDPRLADAHDRIRQAEQRISEIENSLATLTDQLVNEADVAVALAEFDGVWSALSPREQARVQKRANWIVKQRAYFDQFHPLTPPRRFVGGETHFYLGRQYRLKLVGDAKTGVKLRGRFLWVHLPDRADTGRIEKLLDQWYRDHAEPIFARRLDECLCSARSLNVERPELTIRKMVKRWGSCTKGGRILLNTELVKTPLYCIEYVIMHELCHLRLHDHSPEFYRLLARCMPDWEQRKRRLECFIL